MFINMTVNSMSNTVLSVIAGIAYALKIFIEWMNG